MESAWKVNGPRANQQGPQTQQSQPNSGNRFMKSNTQFRQNPTFGGMPRFHQGPHGPPPHFQPNQMVHFMNNQNKNMSISSLCRNLSFRLKGLQQKDNVAPELSQLITTLLPQLDNLRTFTTQPHVNDEAPDTSATTDVNATPAPVTESC